MLIDVLMLKFLANCIAAKMRPKQAQCFMKFDQQKMDMLCIRGKYTEHRIIVSLGPFFSSLRATAHGGQGKHLYPDAERPATIYDS